MIAVLCLISSVASAQNFPPQVPISELPPGGAVQSGDLFPANRSGVTYGVMWPPGSIPLSNLASQSANILLGTVAIGAPTALPMPSCSASNSALTWTTGSGLGCHSINATGIPLSGLTGAMRTSTIDNVNATQTWTWNSLTTQTALSIALLIGHIRKDAQPWRRYKRCEWIRRIFLNVGDREYRVRRLFHQHCDSYRVCCLCLRKQLFLGDHHRHGRANHWRQYQRCRDRRDDIIDCGLQNDNDWNVEHHWK